MNSKATPLTFKQFAVSLPQSQALELRKLTLKVPKSTEIVVKQQKNDFRKSKERPLTTSPYFKLRMHGVGRCLHLE